MNNLVYLKNDEPVCSSLQVAEKFGKRHDNVMQSIRGLLKNEGTYEMFKKSSYIEEQNNQKYPMYLMNRDGFSLLVMGFTGKKQINTKFIINKCLKDGTIVNSYKTERECALSCGDISKQAHIHECINGSRKSAYGFLWRKDIEPL